MSTLKTTNIQNASSATTNIALDTSGNVTVGNNVTVGGGITASSGTVVMSSPYTMRNKIINGAMMIDQRNSGSSITADNTTFAVDRFQTLASVNGKFTAQQNAGSVTPPSGFSSYLGYTSSSAYSVGASEIFAIAQKIEGFNIADLGWGTASAQTITISFWVRSSLTGTFSGFLQNSASTRSYVFSYTISSANTWEYKTVTITGDTTGTWLTTNGIGIRLYWTLAAGSSYTTSAGSWVAGDKYGVTGTTSVVGTNGATFYITGVQLERGTVATPFEYRNYQQELAMCQRYYTALGMAGGYTKFPSTSGTISNASVASQSNNTVCSTVFPVQMRTAPTLVFASVDGTLGVIRNSATGATYTVTGYEVTDRQLNLIYATGVTAGMYLQNQFSASAEL